MEEGGEGGRERGREEGSEGRKDGRKTKQNPDWELNTSPIYPSMD